MRKEMEQRSNNVIKFTIGFKKNEKGDKRRVPRKPSRKGTGGGPQPDRPTTRQGRRPSPHNGRH